MSTPIELVSAISAPAILRCIGLDAKPLRDRMDLRACHVFGAPAVAPVSESNKELHTILSWHDGVRLFDLSCYEGDQTGCGLHIFGREEQAEVYKLFVSSIAGNREKSAGEWHEWIEDEGDPSDWVASLRPIASIGSSGDLVVLDSTDCFLLLEFETYIYGPFSANHIEHQWPSLCSFLEWYRSDVAARLKNSWRYSDRTGQQYVVDDVLYGE